MIKNLLLFIVCICTMPLFAQSEDLCDGERLIDPIFSEIQITESIPFDRGTNSFGVEIDLLMDIYEPVGDNLVRRPVVVMAHGGSFISGNRKNPVMVATCTMLAERGYVAASIEYSLLPLLGGIPDSTDFVDTIIKGLGEMKSAIRFFREDGSGDNVYGVDPDLISVGGYSAGAILANHQAMLDEGDEIDEFLQNAVDEQGGFESLGNRLEISDDIISVFNISGSIYRLEFIDERSAPIYSGHGDEDDVVPYMFGPTGGVVNTSGSFLIDETYDEVGVESELFTFVGGGHTDIFTSAEFSQDLSDMYDGFFVFNQDIVCNRLLSSSKEIATTSASIFPNPSNGELNFQFGNDLTSDYNIEVFNQLGQLIYSSQQFNDTTAQLNLNNMDQGLYLVKVNFADNFQPITKRVVISNN